MNIDLKSDSEIFLCAAVRLFNSGDNYTTCWSLAHASLLYHEEFREKFAEYFKPERFRDVDLFWFESPNETDDAAIQSHRILSLVLMSEIAKEDFYKPVKRYL